jgi:flap endonuclease-1
MGIKNLSSLLNTYAPNCISKKQFSDLTGKKIAIDSALLIYSYVIAIRNSSEDITNIDGEITSHIHAVVSKTLLYLDNGITPIYVFDGKPPSLKNDVLDKRKEEREMAKKLLEDEEDDKLKSKHYKKLENNLIQCNYCNQKPYDVKKTKAYIIKHLLEKHNAIITADDF